MKIRMNLLLIIGAMVFALSTCIIANAQAPAAGKDAAAGDRKKLMQSLTPEQRAQLQQKMKEMREQGKKREEIRAALAEMLKGWNIEMPAGRAAKGEGKGAGKGAGMGMNKQFLANLTPDQRAQLEAKVNELKAAGKTPEEIRAAVAELLKGWGIEAPAGGPGRQDGRGPAWMGQLTEEQRAQVQAKMKEMRAAGKTQQEIHAAVMEMLKGWGIQAPATPAAK
jgi:Spy/CpxP family protein refolding chaperone